MTKEEIKRAADELGERVEGKKDTGVDHSSIVDLLSKAIDGLINRNHEEPVVKSEELTEEETTREKAVNTAEKVGQEKFYEEVVSKSDDNLQEMIDAAPALEALTDAIAASMGSFESLRKSQEITSDRLELMESAIVPLLKGMQTVLEVVEAVRDHPVSNTSPGFVLAPGSSREEGSDDSPRVFRDKLQKAVTEGHLHPRFLAMVDTRSEENIRAILPEGVNLD